MKPTQSAYRGVTQTVSYFAAVLAVTGMFFTKTTVAQPADETGGPSIFDLVAQLDADTLAERTAAEKALIAIGPSILPKLPATDDNTSAQLKQRIAVIRQVLEKQVAASISEAKTVRMTGIFTLEKVLAAIEKQTGNRFAFPQSGDTDVKVEFEDTPFWQAADTVLDQVGLDIVALGGQPNRLVLSARPPNARDRLGNAHYTGVFRVEPIRVFSVRDLRNPGADVMRVTMSVAWEPRLSPISMLHDMATIKALDEGGNVIASAAEGRRNLSVQPGMSAVEIELPLQLPDRSVESIASLQGELEVLIPSHTESFEFGGDLEAARGVEIKRAGATVILEQVRQSDGIQQVRMRLRFEDALNALESHRGWVFSNRAYLIGPKGEKIPNAGFNSTGQSDNEVGVAYNFVVDDGLKGHKFVYETPASIIRQKVVYEVKNIALP